MGWIRGREGKRRRMGQRRMGRRRVAPLPFVAPQDAVVASSRPRCRMRQRQQRWRLLPWTPNQHLVVVAAAVVGKETASGSTVAAVGVELTATILSAIVDPVVDDVVVVADDAVVVDQEYAISLVAELAARAAEIPAEAPLPSNQKWSPCRSAPIAFDTVSKWRWSHLRVSMMMKMMRTRSTKFDDANETGNPSYGMWMSRCFGRHCRINRLVDAIVTTMTTTMTPAACRKGDEHPGRWVRASKERRGRRFRRCYCCCCYCDD